jgi:large subunit ribosomal protein L28
MRECSVCGKGPQFGRNVRYSHGGKWELRAPKTNRRWLPNLQVARVANGGATKKILVCTKCLKAGKVARAA